MADDGNERLIRAAAGRVTLEGNLNLPEGARGIVLFAHGSGSSRLSPRNRYVAQMLRQARLGTLLVDLLTSEEEAIDLRFDIGLLAERFMDVTDWLLDHLARQQLAIGYFGASTGAAAALMAAAERSEVVGVIVSRGGRPDLAGPLLPDVRAPTLLIVGGNDVQVIGLSRAALAQLQEAARDCSRGDTSLRRTGRTGRGGAVGSNGTLRARRFSGLGPSDNRFPNSKRTRR